MSALKSAASRANGAKSNGPVTIQGKARSAQNAGTHGIFRSPFVLRNERNTDFLQLEADFKEEWDPQGPTETALVEQMIVCQWRLIRIWQTEVAGIDLQMDHDAPQLARDYQEIDEPCRGATAFKHLADQSNFLDLMQRYDRSLSRQFDRALVRLKELKRDRPQPDEPETAKLRNEQQPAEPELIQPDAPKLQNQAESAAAPEVELQSEPEPEPLPEIRAILPAADARRILAALGYNLRNEVPGDTSRIETRD